MKKLTTVLGLLLIISCKPSTTEQEIESLFVSDTISVNYRRYYTYGNDFPEEFKYSLIKQNFNDSILTFKYFQDTTLKKHFSFLIKQGQFELVETDYEQLVPVDTFEIEFLNEQLTVYKYENFLPPIDGELGFLFNKKYGLLGYSSYSWANQTILTEWKEFKFENELKSILLADNVRYLKRQEISPPPPPKHLKQYRQTK